MEPSCIGHYGEYPSSWEQAILIYINKLSHLEQIKIITLQFWSSHKGPSCLRHQMEPVRTRNSFLFSLVLCLLLHTLCTFSYFLWLKIRVEGQCTVLLKELVMPLTLPKIKQYRVIPKAHMSAAFPLYWSRESDRKLVCPNFRLVSLDVYCFTFPIHQIRSTLQSFCDQIFIPSNLRGITENFVKD